MAIGPKKMAREGEAAGNRWWGDNFIIGVERNVLAGWLPFFAPIVGGETICSFFKQY